MFENLVIAFTLSTFLIGTYLIWFSRKNIFNHLLVGLCFVAYFVPCIILDFSEYKRDGVWDQYLLINVIACISFVTALFLGYRWRSIPFVDIIMQFQVVKYSFSNEQRMFKIIGFVSKVFTLSIIGVAASYLVMGYVPMFAAEPFLAKFFKAQYQAPYHRVAILYRSSRQVMEILLPLKVLLWYSRRRLFDLVQIVLATALIAVSLTRGPVLLGLLIALAIVICLKRTKLPVALFIFGILASFTLGSATYYMFAVLFPDSAVASLGFADSFWDAVAYGAPDIPDQLNFLRQFNALGAPKSYGLTFIGGLIPFNFPWNPSAYTLRILNDTNDISEIASGGLRLPVSLWGYVSFGWFGVVFVPFASAFFLGYITRRVKNLLHGLRGDLQGYVGFYFVYFMFSYLGVLFYNFYTLAIYSLPAVFFYYVLFRRKRPLASNSGGETDRLSPG